MENVLAKTRELLKDKTFEEQLEIMFQMRKKYLKLEHLEWYILDILDDGDVYYVEIEEDPIGGIYDIENDKFEYEEENNIWQYQYTKEDIEKIVFRYLGCYEYGYPMNKLTYWYHKNK